LAAAGVQAVGRYLADDSRGITAGEYQDLVANGVRVWVCKEGTATQMLNGFGQGVADAQAAQAQLVAAGIPADSMIYATADFDVSANQFPACDGYMQGFASVLGLSRTGIYGGGYYLNHVHDLNLASGYWLSASTSFAHGEAPRFTANFEQTTLTPPLPGMDHDYIYDLTTVAGSGAIALENDLDARQDNLLTQIYNALMVGGDSQTLPDGGHPLARSIADIKAIVARPVQRDGHELPQIQDNADTGTLVRQLKAELAALQAALASLPSVPGATVDLAAVQAAAQAGAAAALSALTLKAVV
jgi:hypothetical protein